MIVDDTVGNGQPKAGPLVLLGREEGVEDRDTISPVSRRRCRQMVTKTEPPSPLMPLADRQFFPRHASPAPH